MGQRRTYSEGNSFDSCGVLVCFAQCLISSMPGFSKLLVFNTELIFAMKIDRVISLAMLHMFELLFRTTAESSGDYVFRLGQRWRRRMPSTWDRGLQDTGYRSRRSCRHRCGIDTDDVKKYCPRYARIDIECAFLMNKSKYLGQTSLFHPTNSL